MRGPRAGRPIPNMTKQQLENFWAKVKKTESCWLWTAATTVKVGGYGRFAIMPHGLFVAHRIAYTLKKGSIPEGLALDHLCRERLCVNPEHLEPVEHRENTLRGDAGEHVARRERAKTHCPHGHEYNEENTYWEKSRPSKLRGGISMKRKCRTCCLARSKAAAARKRQERGG